MWNFPEQKLSSYAYRTYSLAPVRVTSSVCLRVRGSRSDVIVRLHSYDDIGSITTYRVAGALVVIRLVAICRTLVKFETETVPKTSAQLFLAKCPRIPTKWSGALERDSVDNSLFERHFVSSTGKLAT